MEIQKKKTVLLNPALHEHLTRLAKQRGKSLGELVRSACESQYRFLSREQRLKAVEEIGRLALPVGSPAKMKRQSVLNLNELPE